MIFKIAFRNIFRQKRRSFLTILTMFGGFVLAAFSTGWMDGTYNNIINMFTRNQLGHIQIHRKGYLDKPSLYKTIDDYDEIGRTIDSIKGVETWSPRLYSSGLASLGEKSTGISIIGIDPVRENESTHFDRKIISGSTFQDRDFNQVILGKTLAWLLKADVDSEIVVISQAADGSIANDIYRTVGIAETGDGLTDRTAFYLRLGDAQELLALQGQVHEMVIIVSSLDEVRHLARVIQSRINDPQLSVEPWQEFAKPFYEAMQADKRGGWIMIFVIILIVAIGVLNTVLMTVLERQREYGVLRAIGMRPGQIFALVTAEVAVMSVIGVIIGLILSLPINYFFSFNGIPLPQEFTYGGMVFSKGYTIINAHSFYLPIIAVIVSAMFISIFPALRAARIEPARAMRIH
jgi:putative ABC transport system permease protein